MVESPGNLQTALVDVDAASSSKHYSLQISI
jgi:hypothetical protein